MWAELVESPPSPEQQHREHRRADEDRQRIHGPMLALKPVAWKFPEIAICESPCRRHAHRENAVSVKISAGIGLAGSGLPI
jgi:hypothetical protein